MLSDIWLLSAQVDTALATDFIRLSSNGTNRGPSNKNSSITDQQKTLNSGPRILPCGTPIETGSASDKVPLKWVF